VSVAVARSVPQSLRVKDNQKESRPTLSFGVTIAGFELMMDE
jgi:hypothetical protein